MIGKTLKKRRWCELRQHERSDPEALSTAKEVADSFSKAESARGEGDREHATANGRDRRDSYSAVKAFKST